MKAWSQGIVKYLLMAGCFGVFGLQPLHAQYTRYVVRFTDKAGTPHSISNPSTFLSAKAIARRQMFGIPVDSTDLPISPAYLSAIAAVPHVTIMNRSKWFNQVLIVITDLSALDSIAHFSFVKQTEAVGASANFNQPEPINKLNEPIRSLPDRSLISGAFGRQGLNGASSLDYGNTYNQIHIHEGDYLHDMGFTGNGMTIAILDAGFFSYPTNHAMDSVRLQGRILGTWDFVKNEASVSEDHPHGLYCFSIMAANKPGELVGSAPSASYWLLRSEDASSEYPAEEQNWAAAAEFADSAGADIITSSLGYSEFDDPAFNHPYAGRDGHTTLITRAANLAFHKGMIVTISAGNSGNLATDSKYVICPADGESVLAVGATDINGNIASFSSWGPNGAGRLKPDVVSVGQGTILANTIGNAASGNGTSFSNPNLCGLIACLWQAFPEFRNSDIIDAVVRSADRYQQPDNRYGYGLPNFHNAYLLLSKERDLRNIRQILGNQWIKAYPVPFQGGNMRVALHAPGTGKAQIQVLDAMGRTVLTKQMDVEQDQLYVVDLPGLVRLARGVYFIRFNDGMHKAGIAVIKR